MRKVELSVSRTIGGAANSARHWSGSMGSMLNKVVQIAVVGRFGLAVRFQDGASGGP
jgi:hypothetical protein